MTQSAAASVSLTETAPSSTATRQLPAPSTSKRYVAVRPRVRVAPPAVRAARSSKNSLALVAATA